MAYIWLNIGSLIFLKPKWRHMIAYDSIWLHTWACMWTDILRIIGEQQTHRYEDLRFSCATPTTPHFILKQKKKSQQTQQPPIYPKAKKQKNKKASPLALLKPPILPNSRSLPACSTVFGSAPFNLMYPLIDASIIAGETLHNSICSSQRRYFDTPELGRDWNSLV